MDSHPQRNQHLFLTVILLATLLFAAPSLFAATNVVEKLASADCLDCHSDPTTFRTVNGEKIALALFPTNGFKRSVHNALDCIDCHDGQHKTEDRLTTIKANDCNTCHTILAQGAGAELDQLAPAGQKFRHSAGDYAGACNDCHNGGPW